jgi:ubiquinone biosynthesis protein
LLTSFKGPPEKVFAFFDPKPLGSASIGQVHAARLFDGREVIVKVRKPGVDELVQIDLEIIGSPIDEWSPHLPILVEYDEHGLHRNFGDTLRAELDYTHEAANVKSENPMGAYDRFGQVSEMTRL